MKKSELKRMIREEISNLTEKSESDLHLDNLTDWDPKETIEGETIESVISSKLGKSDWKTIQKNKPFSMYVGIFKIELYFDHNIKLKNVETSRIDMSETGGPSSAYFVSIKI